MRENRTRTDFGVKAAYDPQALWNEPLLDHLVGADEDRLRDREAEGVRGLEIDHEVDLRQLQNRQVRGLGALKNATDVGGGRPVGLEAPDRVDELGIAAREVSDRAVRVKAKPSDFVTA